MQTFSLLIFMQEKSGKLLLCSFVAVFTPFVEKQNSAELRSTFSWL